MYLEMRNITKSFPGVLALDQVSLRVEAGEIHAVVGENGAGKSTLMNILAGALQRDAGDIFIAGERVEIPDPQAARRLGVGIVYQNLNIIPDLTVAENLTLAKFPLGAWSIDFREMRREAERKLADLHADIDPAAVLGGLSVADQQMVAIARAITPETRILIMDEPTSSLTPKEVEAFFRVVRVLKGKGVSLIFISHHLDEVFSITERVTVLRDGKLIGDWKTAEMTEDELIAAMAGRPVVDLFPKLEVPIGDTVLEVRDLESRGRFSGVGFSVRKGEILGIGGLVGAGRSEVLKAIFGEYPVTGGEIRMDGRPVRIDSPRAAVAQGLAFISEDRAGEGLILPATIADNITLPRLKTFLKGVRLDRREEMAESARLSQKLGVKAVGPQVAAGTLSGGNQQKVALAKWFGMSPRVLLLDEPTRGIDVGAKAEIYRLLGEMARAGLAVVMVSSELPELLAISDRIAVMCKGRQVGIFDRKDATAEGVMLAATGGRV